jgi:hypothetical protein
MPVIHLNLGAIALAVGLNFMLGYLWYAVLFNRAWARATGREGQPDAAATSLAIALVMNVVAAALMVYVLANNMAVWKPATWGLSTPGTAPLAQAMAAAGFSWLGFVLPIHLHRFAWEGRSLPLLLINAGYGLLGLLIAAVCLAWL